MQVLLTYIHMHKYTSVCTYGNTKGRQAKQKMVYSFPLMIVLPILCDFYRGLRAKLLLPFSAQWLFATCSLCTFQWKVYERDTVSIKTGIYSKRVRG